MPAPVIVSGTQYRIKLKFGEGGWGWTETYYYSNSSGGFRVAILAAIALAARRKPLLAEQGILQAFTIAEGIGPFGVWQQFPWDVGKNIPEPVGPIVPVWDAMMCDAWDSSLRYRRKFILRGLSNQSYGRTIATGQRLGNAKLFSDLRPFLNFLSETQVGTNGQTPAVGVQPFPVWCIRGNSKVPAAQRLNTVTGGTLAADGCTLTLSTVGGNSYSLGQKVLLRRIHTTSGALLHGSATVTTAGSATVVMRINRCCCGPATVLPGGDISIRTPNLYSIFVAAPNRIIKHSTGKGFFGTVGRRGRCKC